MSVEIEGRTYITSAEYAKRFKRDPSGLRAAAGANRHGLGEAALDINARTRVYPLDLVKAWRKEADAHAWARKGHPKMDAIRIAERYDLERTMVYRALKSGRLVGKRDDAGRWHIADEAAAHWASYWLGINEPVNPDA